MGTSFTLIEKDFLVLSLEVSKQVQLEMSCGFGSCRDRKAYTGTCMTLSIDELKSVIDKLTSIHNELSKAKICPMCGQINPPESEWCNNCDCNF